MEQGTYTIDASLQRLLGAQDISMGDVQEIKHLIRGGSVIDWRRLYFRSLPAVNDFLRVAQYDPDNRAEMERLQTVHRNAVDYLTQALGIDIPSVLARPHRLQNVFLYASNPDGPHQSLACMILKVMHVINHLEARQLLYYLPSSERELFSRVEKRVSKTVMRMIELGFVIEEYVSSEKTKDSLITKILSKRRSTAAQVFDRIRFRIITSARKNVIPILYYLNRHLFPFPHVIPGESSNTVAPVATLVEEAFGFRPEDDDEALSPAFNRFTHREFRVISFVVDVPLRVDDLIDQTAQRQLSRFGHVVFIPTEFQVFDRASYFLNESGPAAHSHYKERQVQEVIKRLYASEETGGGPVQGDDID
jgi:uncharacterized protein (TIGR04552 family)